MDDLSSQSVLKPLYPRWFGLCLILIANIVPLVGVAYWGWDVRDIVVIYWVESIVIGALHLLRISRLPSPQLVQFSIMIYFALIYGLFITALSLYLWALFDAGEVMAELVSFGGLFWAAVLLCLSHALSLWRDWRAAEPRDASALEHPFPRLAVMFVVIIFGGIGYKLFNTPLSVMSLLVAAKLIFDVGGWVRTREPAPRWSETVLSSMDKT